MLVIKTYVDEDIILDLGDGREVRVAFKGSKREAGARLCGSIGIHAPLSVIIKSASIAKKKPLAGSV